MSDIRDDYGSPEFGAPDVPEEPQIFPEQEDDYEVVKEPITVKRVAIVGGRVVTGLVGIGVAAVTIATAALVPLPSFTASPASQLITPVPTAQQLVCPGAILRLADDEGEGATISSPIGRPTVDSAASSSAVDATPLEQSDASTGGTAAAPTVISTPPNQDDPTAVNLLSGAQVQSASEGEFVGLTAGDCGTVSGDVWLAGGSTSVGRTTLLTLSNPTEVPATVNIELFGESGPITAPGTSGIVVPASGQRVVSLAGFQPDVASPVVHITSTGGQVVAQLQQATVRGLVAGGLDIIGPTVSPSLDNIIPGVVITDLVAVQELAGGGEAFNDLRTVLRLFAPGDEPVSATVSVTPEDGSGTGASFVFDLDGGRVVDLPVGELENGSYTVRVVSDAPTLAAVRVSAAVGSATDFAWMVSAPQLPDPAQVTIADGPSPVLHLANPTDADVTVTAVDLSVPVPAGTTATVAVDPGETYQLSGYEQLMAAVTFTNGSEIASYTVHPQGAGSTPIRVYR
ncbi:hypothetical protein BH10ACT7_BH10ACT7_10270 [soil metagenome]